MEHGVRKHRIEGRVAKRQFLRSGTLSLDSTFSGRRHHLRRRIHAQHVRAALGNAPGQLSVATAQIEHIFSRARIEPLQYSAGKSVHKCTGPLVGKGVPRLRRHRNLQDQCGRKQDITQSYSNLVSDKKMLYADPLVGAWKTSAWFLSGPRSLVPAFRSTALE